VTTATTSTEPPTKDRDPELAEANQDEKKKTKKEPDFFNTGNKKTSLQDHFNRFRKAKKQDIKYRNYVAEQAVKNRKDAEFKDRLRQKFIETAKKYFGVPYGAKYWKEGEKHYNAPLYLDCCALVRQVVYDLREDFGFQLDRWNQAYQFDTLPIDLKFEEMKPGDLVFYSAIYYNEKMRK
jgi:cell wall-associated NlpC family hydrolase